MDADNSSFDGVLPLAQMGARENRRAIDGDECDAFGRWRKVHAYLLRPGVTANIKRKARRRERHQARAALR